MGFVLTATFGLMLFAWYLAAGGLPWLMPISTQELFQLAPRWVGAAFKLWMTTAAILTLALPLLALVAFAAAPAPAGLARRGVDFILRAGLVFWSANLLVLLALMVGRTLGG